MLKLFSRTSLINCRKSYNVNFLKNYAPKSHEKFRYFSETKEEPESIEYKRKIVNNIKQNVIYLKNEAKGSDIFVIGTAHVSKISADEVKTLIRFVKPDAVMVELDIVRAKQLREGGSEGSFSKDILSKIGKMDFGQILLKHFFNTFYNYFRSLALIPGLEFLVAMQEAEKLGAKIVYGDQSSDITIKRMAENFSFLGLVKGMKIASEIASEITSEKLVQDLKTPSFQELIESIKDRKKIRRVTTIFKKAFPDIYKPLAEERDHFMVNSLKQIDAKKIVAVVGLAHLDGIEKIWHTEVD